MVRVALPSLGVAAVLLAASAAAGDTSQPPPTAPPEKLNTPPRLKPQAQPDKKTESCPPATEVVEEFLGEFCPLPFAQPQPPPPAKGHKWFGKKGGHQGGGGPGCGYPNYGGVQPGWWIDDVAGYPGNFCPLPFAPPQQPAKGHKWSHKKAGPAGPSCPACGYPGYGMQGFAGGTMGGWFGGDGMCEGGFCPPPYPPPQPPPSKGHKWHHKKAAQGGPGYAGCGYGGCGYGGYGYGGYGMQNPWVFAVPGASMMYDGPNAFDPYCAQGKHGHFHGRKGKHHQQAPPPYPWCPYPWAYAQPAFCPDCDP